MPGDSRVLKASVIINLDLPECSECQQSDGICKDCSEQYTKVAEKCRTCPDCNSAGDQFCNECKIAAYQTVRGFNMPDYQNVKSRELSSKDDSKRSTICATAMVHLLLNSDQNCADPKGNHRTN